MGILDFVLGNKSSPTTRETLNDDIKTRIYLANEVDTIRTREILRKCFLRSGVNFREDCKEITEEYMKHISAHTGYLPEVC